MNNLAGFIVLYRDYDEDLQSHFGLSGFSCFADDFSDAEKQCLNASPQCKILSITIDESI